MLDMVASHRHMSENHEDWVRGEREGGEGGGKEGGREGRGGREGGRGGREGGEGGRRRREKREGGREGGREAYLYTYHNLILSQVQSLNTDFIVPMEVKLKEERQNLKVRFSQQNIPATPLYAMSTSRRSTGLTGWKVARE